MRQVERLSQREIHRRTGVHRDTIRKALASPAPPSYGPRSKRPSKLDQFRATIEELLADEPTLSGVRIREELEKLGYVGGKTILDDLLRELRPRFLPPPRSFQRTRYRPGELAQFDLCEPRSEIPVGWGQSRRGYIVTCELPYSRAFAGALVFSKEFPDIAFGMARCLARLGALPDKLVWDREVRSLPTAARARTSSPSAAGSRSAGSSSTRATARPRARSSAATASALKLRGRPALRQPARLPAPARRLVRAHQRARSPHHACARRRAAGRGAAADASLARADAGPRPALRHPRRAAALPAFRPQRLLADACLHGQPTPC
jgi:transposase